MQKIVDLLLVIIAQSFPAAEQNGDDLFALIQQENGSWFFVTERHLGLHNFEFLSAVIGIQPGLPVYAFLKYSLIIILFLLVLWFYRRYEIRRIKRKSSLQDQDSGSEVSSENLDINNFLHAGRKESIDQCLTGWCDNRFCFFYEDGNIIHLEDHLTAGSEPASVELLLDKINAGKFCEHACQVKDNYYSPISRFAAGRNGNGKSKLNELRSYKIKVRPYNLSAELHDSDDSSAFILHKPALYLRHKAISPIDKEFYFNAVNIIEANYADFRFSAEQLARTSNMSVSQFNRKLKTLTGLPAGRLISKFRLQHASEFLVERTDSISEVCFSAGYNGLAYFSRAFKKEFGCTPSVYRQLMTKKSISLRK